MDYGISSSRNWQHINEIRTQKNACRMVPAVEGRYPAKCCLGFYPISTDGLIRAENFRSCRATLRRIRGL